MDLATIHSYSADDRAACLAVFDSNVPRWFDESERPEFEAFLDHLPGPYLVLRDGSGQVVGCGGFALAEGGARADLCWGMVREDSHGRGLGDLLARTRVTRAAADPGVREVTLRTSQLTTGFYERLGFVLRAVEPDGFAPGLDRCEMVLRTDVSRGA